MAHVPKRPDKREQLNEDGAWYLDEVEQPHGLVYNIGRAIAVLIVVLISLIVCAAVVLFLKLLLGACGQ